jgi:hypothetical protein
MSQYSGYSSAPPSSQSYAYQQDPAYQYPSAPDYAQPAYSTDPYAQNPNAGYSQQPQAPPTSGGYEAYAYQQQVLSLRFSLWSGVVATIEVLFPLFTKHSAFLVFL